jgi:hypothetical protein
MGELAQVWLDHFFLGISGQSDVVAVSVHVTVLEISTIHKDVHKVVVELQHPELGILVHEASNVHGQVQSDGLLAHLQLKGIHVQLITSPKGRVHQMTTDLVLLAIQNISMVLLVGHCPPIRRIAFQFLRLCHNLLAGVDISGSSGITDVVPEFLETGCSGVLHHLMYLRHLQTMLDILLQQR